jgi:hypothetical protein
MLKGLATRSLAHDGTTTVPLYAPVRPGGSGATKTRRVDHRDGSGHLDPVYEAELRGRVRAQVYAVDEWAFVRGRSSRDPEAEDAGEEFVMTVTSGVDGGERARRRE